MEIIAELVMLLLEIFGEVLLDAGLSRTGNGRTSGDGILTLLAWLFLGALGGLVSVWLLPDRILRPGPLPGLSLVLTPLIVGSAMQLWGDHRRAHGHSTTYLATFPGGAAFAWAWAAVRFFATG
jgi:hypothetical protein